MTPKILVVDDSPLIRRMVRRALVQAGAEDSAIHEAENGAIALEKVQAEDFASILLDLNMPVMDGETFLRRLREDHPELTPDVVVVSTEANGPRILALRGLGIVGFLGKPFQPEELRELVTERLEAAAGQDREEPAPEPAVEQADAPTIPSEELDQAVTESLERMAFVLAMACDEPAAEATLHSFVEFDSDEVRGALRVSGSEGFAREAASGMTGLEEEDLDPDDLANVINELANILAGRMIVLLGGEESVFRLGIPSPVEGPQPEREQVLRTFDSMGEGFEIALHLEAA